MLKNYFKLAWRSLIKNKFSGLLNISGLAVGLTTGILMMLWVADELSYDQFYAGLADIHLLMNQERRGGEIQTGRSTCGPLAAALRNEMPEVKAVARVSQTGSQLFRYNDKSLYEDAFFAEPDFFRIMQMQAVAGDPAAALEAGSAVMTETAARKIFGNENPIGRILTHNNQHVLKVGSVIRDIPHNSTLQFEVVLPFRIFEQENDWTSRWDYNALLTWIALKPGASLAALNRKLQILPLRKNNDSSSAILAYPLAKLWLHGKFSNGKPAGGRIDMVLLLATIGLFVLLIACINFMNLATARSEIRAREVGVRKTLGSSRRHLIFQFLGEAFLITGIALIIGIVLAKLTLPAFNRFSEKDIPFDFTNYKIWVLLLSLGVFTALIAGSYPAFFLSRFQPAKVLKGMGLGSKGGGILRKALVTFQFVISIFLIISTVVIIEQVSHVQNRPIGYDQENLIDLPGRGDMAGKFEQLRNGFLQIPGVGAVSAGTDDLVNYSGATNDIIWPGKTPDQNFMICVSWVQYDWVKTTGIVLTGGRDFDRTYPSDSLACLLNQTAVKKMGLKGRVIGTKLGQNTVIGVLKDFVYNNPSGAPGPLVVYLSKGNMNHFFVRVQNNQDWKQTIARIQTAFKKTNPNYPFEFQFTKENYQIRFNQMQSTVHLFDLIGGLAIFISCLGLFGLSAFLSERRSKEISIRKVLGARVSGIWLLLTYSFLKPVLLAFLISAPIAGWVMEKLLLNVDYHIQLSGWMFAIAGIASGLVALITVSFQVIKAAIVNPTFALRSE